MAFFSLPVHLQLVRALVQPALIDVFEAGALERELFHRQEQHLFLELLGALARRAELANRF